MGRIDAVVETGSKFYIMEFKMGSEKDAMAQIKEKAYYEKYLGKGKEMCCWELVLIPANGISAIICWKPCRMAGD